MKRFLATLLALVLAATQVWAANVAVQGPWWPNQPTVAVPPVFNAGAVIDATGEKIALVGRVWNKDRATKSIRTIGFRFGTITKAGGSALTVSLQNVDAAAGPVYQPDGTQDQTVAIANGNAAFASNTWITTGNLSADRSVAFGELISVVIEYDGGGRLGADSVIVAGFSGLGTSQRNLAGGVALLTASWAALSIVPDVVLGFSDGTFGTLDEGIPASATNNLAYNSGSGADEAALEFTFPVTVRADAVYLVMQAAASADFDVVVYEGTTAVATVSVDVNTIELTGTARPITVPIPETTLTANTTYRLALKPTTANNVTLYYLDVSSADHFQAHPGFSTWAYTTRVDAGSWAAATTTRRPFMGIRLSGVDSGGGGQSFFGGGF